MRTFLALCMALTAVWVALAAEGDKKPDPKIADPLQPNISVTPRVRPKGTPDESVTDRRADIRIDTTLVLIPVSVTDPLNRFVTGLEKENFKISEEKVDQEITQFSSEDAPFRSAWFSTPAAAWAPSSRSLVRPSRNS